MMKYYLSSVAVIFFLCVGGLSAQPITSPFVFIQSGSDTGRYSILPEPPIGIGIDRVAVHDGHFVLLNIETAATHRIRFFGTELEYTSQFINSSDAHTLAKRLHKLGFNAIRLIYNDEVWWPQGSLLNYPSATTSYNINPDQLSRFDTLIYELKQQGIYTFLVLNSEHTFIAADGVAQADSTQGAEFTHFIDKRASELHRQWAKTLLTHLNPLSGMRLADDPALAAVEVSSPGYSLFCGWRFGLLNWIDTNNAINKGAQTIGWNRSRRLDTLFTQYLLRKYGSESGIDNAWKGPPLINPPNLVSNGSFEQVGSTAWSFSVQNGVTGDKSLLSPGIDSQFCMWTIINSLSSNPNWSDAVLVNSTPRLGKDTLYELSFYAKIHFDPAKPVLSRSIFVYVEQYLNYTGSFSTTQTIDTTWRKYTFTFRARAGGLQRLYFGIGNQLGDVLFDAVSLKQTQELGLVFGETSNTFSIYRLKYNESELLPYQRVRDITLFYDSLQNDYFLAMKNCISDTIKSPVLVNFYCPEWWGSIQDVYANRFGDFAQAHINSDYPRQRNANVPYTDSTWVMSNTSILTDLYNGVMGYLASAAIAGKPFIGRYMNLVTNQQCAALIPFYTSYASLQDWDGLFFPNYANYYEDLFANEARPGSWWSIAGNPSLLAQMPQASDAFRNEKIKASGLRPSTTILHDPDDMLLKSLPSSSTLSLNNTGVMGVEGYLQPNIATMFQIRQQFDTTIHKVAAEYPYQFDTITKVSETGEIQWSQTGDYFLTHATEFAAAAGHFGNDTVTSGSMKFRRLDNAHDMQSILLSQLSPSTMLLTIASRSQNYKEIWQYNDSSIGNHWGGAPTIMSAGKFEFFINSDSSRVIAHPLDSSGKPQQTGVEPYSIEGVKIPGTNVFKLTLDQSIEKTPWYYIEQIYNSSSVLEHGAATSDVSISPNPSTSELYLRLSLENSGVVKVLLFDDLGREVAHIVNGELYSGTYNFQVNVQSLPAGHYILRADLSGQTMSRNVNIIR
jgi:hypothetical protein